MCCYECSLNDERRDAVGICHHCSVGVCKHHASIIDDAVTMTLLIAKKVVLPLKARLLLCEVCLRALNQERAEP